MRDESMNSEDVKLSGLLREVRESPALPPRFQEGVWSRIQRGEQETLRESPGWLDALAIWMFRPRAALAGAAILLVAGAVLGAREGAQVARRDAQAHYLATVAPNPLR